MRMRRFGLHVLFAVGMLLNTHKAFAHEFWLMPIQFSVDTPGLLRVETLNGERFQGTVLPRRDDHIKRFEVLDPSGTAQPVLGRNGNPLSLARLTTPGMHRVAYESVENKLELDAQAFESYLAEEGLSNIIDDRAQLGESNKPGREVYVRCAKTLVLAGSPNLDNQIDKSCGLPLEFILEGKGQPMASHPITAVVLHNEQPIRDLRVIAVSASDPDVRHELFSDSDGKVRFTPESSGVWMFTTITMERLESREDADWKSWWSSVTFEVISKPKAG
ncbi:MAG: DUF4198 domain-containing protein [Phycisphaerales bacterium]